MKNLSAEMDDAFLGRVPSSGTRGRAVRGFAGLASAEPRLLKAPLPSLTLQIKLILQSYFFVLSLCISKFFLNK